MSLRNGYRALFAAYAILFPWIGYKALCAGDMICVFLCSVFTVAALLLTYLSIFKPRF